jgi:hypothetical protein
MPPAPPPQAGPGPHRPHPGPWLAGLALAAALLFALIGGIGPAAVPAAGAASVDWREVPPTEAGRQWWDAGSLRITRGGNLSVLSRFQRTVADDERAPLSDLYVMEIDCGQTLYRDTSVNGLPRFGAEWQPAEGDPLLMAVIRESCEAAAPLLQAG